MVFPYCAPAFAGQGSNRDSEHAIQPVYSYAAPLGNYHTRVAFVLLGDWGETIGDRSSKVSSERQAWWVIHHHPTLIDYKWWGLLGAVSGYFCRAGGGCFSKAPKPDRETRKLLVGTAR